jgi:hypothetical protein
MHDEALRAAEFLPDLGGIVPYSDGSIIAAPNSHATTTRG